MHIRAVHHRERIKFNIMAHQTLKRPDNVSMRRFTGTRHPPFIMQCSITINRDADQKILLPEKTRPCIVDQNAVRLKGINDCFSGRLTLLEFNGPPIKRNPHQRRLSSLPRKNNVIHILCGDMLFDE